MPAFAFLPQILYILKLIVLIIRLLGHALVNMQETNSPLSPVQLISTACLLLASFTLSSTEIKLGMSTALSGPTKNLGLQVRQGAETYFKQYNQSEKGRKHPITLISYDDGYEPHDTVINTIKLIEDDKVFALFGYVGTPTSKAIMPLLEEHNIIYFSPYTGADFLRSPIKKNIFNIRASYYTEAETQVEYFIDQLNLSKAALFIQADAFGLTASKGYKNALSARGISAIEQLRYKRNTSDIALATERLKQLNPEVIFCVGTYEPIAKLINELRAANINSHIVMLSFVGAQSLIKRLKYFNNVYVTLVMQDPHESQLPIVKDYRKAMAGQALSHESLEGYVDAAVFAAIVSSIKGEINHKSFIRYAEQLRMDLGGLPIYFSEYDHQGLNKAYLNQITPAGLKPVGDKSAK
ncbi:ABC transporter substrate-binding protein [Thalassomonas actiniarum]|uniref:ABC transporter substrate-binding protein n=2 Tax=Thalassomonas actiniarum TaxID=485447 RepID=A0AAE9YZ27_9GAMM|nr:ABC transporter substrate-binding protein [Thalassomonas actiniarum]